ncbi:hypothetical protein ACFQAT_28110 [Undibacterium arcticum]
MVKAASMHNLFVRIQQSQLTGASSLDAKTSEQVKLLLADLDACAVVTSNADVQTNPLPRAMAEPGTHVCMRCELQSRVLQRAKEALTNVPIVGESYDQQHSDTHMRASIAVDEMLNLPTNLYF